MSRFADFQGSISAVFHKGLIKSNDLFAVLVGNIFNLSQIRIITEAKTLQIQERAPM